MRRQILSRSLLTVAAASSILAVTGGYASADTDAQGGGADSGHSADDHSADDYSDGATADSSAHGSPGVLSGNSVNIPVEAPVNVCGNSVDVAALLNAVSGNSCANGAAPAPVVPGPRHSEPPAPQVDTPAAPAPAPEVQLAETGTSSAAVGTATGAGAALLLSGAMLYRRSTRAARIRRTYS
ncbi:chaplin [Actinacidiphila bryophytorum]|uniref:LPXTG-motif cell wall anchor domain-containing protein n=1 Tax=Actinacidiphila bryophytorum TaxID=1436133 RepID=A0A9W4MID2_9ACTN|nr:chaplin [Actinacidiphila bryophytorum]MBM9435713.1 chaplin [Actinacidiphila bryophytorum]MBN6543891.1 chaplin [Actinacidiphila bryophytorum]CAG7650578.1 LPXTG-motif cell wall anchor domain-containing protein [Actinacidiphila bryophytorum]